MGKGLNKLWYIHVTEYYLAVKSEWIMDTHSNVDELQGNYTA